MRMIRRLLGGMLFMTSFAAFSADEAPPSVPAYGLLPAADFRLVRGDCADCAGLPQAMWFFWTT